MSVKTGNRMPVNREPDFGRVAVDALGRAHVFSSHEAAVHVIENDEQFPLQDTFVVHHAVCPKRPKNVERAKAEDAQERLI